MRLALLDPYIPHQPFPSVDLALKNPDGLLAVGGCLSVERLLNAYRLGIFPWFNPDEPILWWSPNPRLVLFPEQLYVSRSLKKTIRKNLFRVSFDTAFSEVLDGCASPRPDALGTWLSPEMQHAYIELHRLGYAHSIETWCDDELVGGLYGVALGQVFFGESMFHIQTDASKVAFVYLVEHLMDWGYQLVDCQVHTSHLASLGAKDISRHEFSKLLENYCKLPVSDKAWRQV